VGGRTNFLKGEQRAFLLEIPSDDSALHCIHPKRLPFAHYIGDPNLTSSDG